MIKKKLQGRELRGALDSISESDWIKLSIYIKNTILKRNTLLGVEHIIDPDDLVNESILRLYQGRRAWDGNRNSLFKVLYNETIRSLLFQIRLREKVGKRKEEHFFENHLSFEGDHSKNLQMIIEYILHDLQEDKVAIDIIKCIIFGISSPKDIANVTGLNRLEVYNGFKRIRRRFRKHRKYDELRKSLHENELLRNNEKEAVLKSENYTLGTTNISA